MLRWIDIDQVNQHKNYMDKENMIIGDSKERVAFDLMKEIASEELSATEEKIKDPRKYYLALYNECLRASYGAKPH
jgi:hypothetical protein